MWSPASAIFASIVIILVSYEATLKRFSARINFKSQFQINNLPQALKYIQIASKLASIVSILVNIALAGEHIFQVLGQYSWVLPQYLWVLSQYLRVLSRWIHPRYLSNFLTWSKLLLGPNFLKKTGAKSWVWQFQGTKPTFWLIF